MSARGPLVVLVVCVTWAVPARAQVTGSDLPVHRPMVAIGGGVFGGAALGDADATLRTATGGDYRLFEIESRFAAAPIVEARAGVGLTRRYAAEVRIAFARPELRSSISADAEGAPAIRVAEQVDQYVIDAALIVTLQRFQFGRAVPFASAGAGYLRQLHEGRTLVAQGSVYHVGGGIMQPLLVRERGFVKGLGVRADARLYLFAHGIEFDRPPQPHFAVTGGVFTVF